MRIGQTLARFVGLAMTILGVVVIANVIDDSYSDGTLLWIMVSGVLGAVGGLLYLLSFDGPDGLRTRRVRLSGWMGMLVLALLPWSFTFLVLPMVLLTIPTLIVPSHKAREEVTRNGRVFTLVRDGGETRVLADVGDDVRVEVVSSSVDPETLLRIAEDISHDLSQHQ